MSREDGTSRGLVAGDDTATKDIQIPDDTFLRERYPEVDEFARHMRWELWANRGKGDKEVWLTCNPRDLCFDIAWHHIKLMAALKAGNVSDIIEHAADVANLAMITWDAWYTQAKDASRISTT